MKKILMMGLIVIFVVGVVSVFGMGTQKAWYGHKSWNKDDGGCKDFEGKSAWLEKMGLSEDATKKEMMEVKKTHWGKMGHKVDMREKFGLDEDASEEEVKEAWKKWKENHFNSK